MRGDITIETVSFIAQNFYYILAGLLVVHIYLAIVFQTLAKKTNSKQSWLAWIPLANFILYAHIAKMRWWPVLLLLAFPLLLLNSLILQILALLAIIIFAVFVYVWLWKILTRVNRPGWLVLLSLVPSVGWLIFLVIIGVVAFTADYTTPQITQVIPQKQTKLPPPKTIRPQRLDRMDKLKKSLGQK